MVLAETLESILSEHGLDATMYIPSKSKSPAVHHAVIKSELGDPRICCEVVSDGAMKKFRFTFDDVLDIRKGKSAVLAGFDDVADCLCLYIAINSKGELILSFISENLRDEIFIGLISLVEQRTGKKLLL